VYAVRKIKKQEEITIAYTDILDSKSERRRKLQLSYGFLCACNKCKLQRGFEDLSEQKRRKLREWLLDTERLTFQRWLDFSATGTDRNKLKALEKELTSLTVLIRDEGLQMLRSASMEIADTIAHISLASGDIKNSTKKVQIARDTWSLDESFSDTIRHRISLYDQWIEDPTSASFWAIRNV
jgi:hypothetical protein